MDQLAQLSVYPIHLNRTTLSQCVDHLPSNTCCPQAIDTMDIVAVVVVTDVVRDVSHKIRVVPLDVVLQMHHIGNMHR